MSAFQAKFTVPTNNGDFPYIKPVRQRNKISTMTTLTEVADERAGERGTSGGTAAKGRSLSSSRPRSAGLKLKMGVG